MLKVLVCDGTLSVGLTNDGYQPFCTVPFTLEEIDSGFIPTISEQDLMLLAGLALTAFAIAFSFRLLRKFILNER